MDGLGLLHRVLANLLELLLLVIGKVELLRQLLHIVAPGGTPRSRSATVEPLLLVLCARLGLLVRLPFILRRLAWRRLRLHP